MKRLQVDLRCESKIETLLELSSVPKGLHTAITRAYKKLEGYGSPGFPRVAKDRQSELLTISYPPIDQALPDRIRYYYNKDGVIFAEAGQTIGNNLPVGVAANRQPSSVYEHKSIVLLLESPHTDEMKHGQPAAGTTGERIHARRVALNSVLKPLVDQLCPEPRWDALPVVIANPCPYPTSCLASTASWGPLRDLVFSKVFPKVKAEFESRLTHYNPLVIINACTDGADPGHILRNVAGAFSIEEGYRPPSPKRLVAASICYRARWMREKWVRVSRQNDGEAPGRGQDSISKPGEEVRGGRVVPGGPPPQVRVRPRQHS